MVNGSNLNQITTVSIDASGYTVKIGKTTTTQLQLDIRAATVGENPKPVANPTLTLNYNGGKLQPKISPGIIPVFYKDNQAWCQCTWYAGIVARIRSGRSEVINYDNSVNLSGNPTTPGFPTANSVIMAYRKHMAFVETSTETSRVTNKDGSAIITYKLTGSQYNARCDAAKSTFSETMVVSKSKTGNYTVTTTPKIAFYAVDRVKQ